MSSTIGLFPETELIQDRRKLFLVFYFFVLFNAVSLPFSHVTGHSSNASVHITLNQ